MKKIKRIVGDLIRIRLGDGSFSFGQLLEDPLVGFYNINSNSEDIDIKNIVEADFLFKVWVMNYTIEDGIWEVIGHQSLSEELLEEAKFYKVDPISKAFSIYWGNGNEIKATPTECVNLERAAVWESNHIENRLQDHFANRPNETVEYFKKAFL